MVWVSPVTHNICVEADVSADGSEPRCESPGRFACSCLGAMRWVVVGWFDILGCGGCGWSSVGGMGGAGLLG